MKAIYINLYVLFVLLSLSNFVYAYDLSEYPFPFIKDGKFNGVIVVGDNAPAEDVIALSDIIFSLQYPVLGSDPESVSGIDTIVKGQTKTYGFSGIYYEVTLNFVDDNSAQFIVNGMTTRRLSIGEGDTLVDGMIITLADIFFENGKYSATIFFGKKKIELEKITVGSGGAKLASEVGNIKSVNSILIGHACTNQLIMKVRENNGYCNAGYEEGVGSIEAYELADNAVSIVITGYSTNETSNAAEVLRFYGYYKPSFKGNKIDVINKNGKLSITPYLKDKKEFKADKSLVKNGFSETYYKLGIFIFIFLVIILLFLILKKNKKV